MKRHIFIVLTHLTLTSIGESKSNGEMEVKNRFQSGCLHTAQNRTENVTKRVCNSDDDKDGVNKSLVCEEPEFNYPEIRIHNGNWDSSVLLAWIHQIILMELARVPATVGFTTNATSLTSFYSPNNTIEYSEEIYGWDGMKRGNMIEGGKLKDCSKTNEPCYHFIPEVWETQKDKYDEFKMNGLIDKPVHNGMFGKIGLYIPSFTAEKYPELAIWHGLKGEERRKKLAEIFPQPTTWKYYCDELSPSNCEVADDIASRSPNKGNEIEEDSYFVKDLFSGYFEYTEENDCGTNPTNCTGALIDCPCTWAVNIESQLYWNDIKGLSSMEYDEDHMIQIWHAANATNNHVIMCWFAPDPLPTKFFESNYSFVEVDFPPPSDECLRNKPNDSDRCSGNVTKAIGNKKGACENNIQILKHFSVKSLGDLNSRLDAVNQSPAVDILKNLEISNVELDSILKQWKQGGDPREAVCDWIRKKNGKKNTIVDSFFPFGYPRKVGNSSRTTANMFLFFAQVFASCVGIVIFLAFVLVWKYRDTTTMTFAQPVFLFLILTGFSFRIIGSFLLSSKLTKTTCAATFSLLILGNTIELVPIIVKTSAINHILRTAAKKRRRVNISRQKMLLRVSYVFAAVVIYLIVWFLIDPPTVITTRFLVPDENNVRRIVESTKKCGSQERFDGWVLTWNAWDGVLLLVAFVLAFQSRNAMKEINESHNLALMVYCHIVFFFIELSLYLHYQSRTLDVPNEYRAMMSIVVSLRSLVAMGVYVHPKIKKAKNNPSNFYETKRRQFSSNWNVLASNSERYSDINCDLQVLVCTANLGNAQPTPESMEAWIPELGHCDRVTPLNHRSSMPSESYDLIAIGMQEATWNGSDYKSSILVTDLTADDLLQSFEVRSTAKLRKMTQTILGDEYYPLVDEQRGQMRFFLWARPNVVDNISDIKISGSNTGVGNVLANKGGIVTSFKYEGTRFSFVTAHLAAHEGDSNYKNRCENLRTILRENTEMLDIGGEMGRFDVTVSSHHMFILGDLNFRTKLDEGTHDEKFDHANKLIQIMDYLGLYELDELKNGLANGDLLTHFQTLPCDFPPTFKVHRESGIVYNRQRIPSYTDRILFKSSDGLSDSFEPLAYEACEDFSTSDHKPVRGAFQITTNDSLDSLNLIGRYHVTISQIKCSNLQIADRDGLLNPYVIFLSESSSITKETSSIFDRLRSTGMSKQWLRTKHIRDTLNPDWGDIELSFSIADCKIKFGQLFFVVVSNHNIFGKDDRIGDMALSMKDIFTFENGLQDLKIQMIERPLVWEGNEAGTVEFKLVIRRL